MQEIIKASKLLRDVTTLGIGGIAAFYLDVFDVPSMQDAIRYAQKNKIPYVVIGKGSNVFFDTRGFKGLVICNKLQFCQELSPGEFYAGAGYSFSLLGTMTAKNGFSGLEFAAGIPASVGGAVFMNAGAQSMDTQRFLAYVDFVDEDGNLKRYDRSELSFGYRHSTFQSMKGAIVGACFRLIPDTNARAKQMQLLHYRIGTQPYQSKSAGCVFKNPDCISAGALIEQMGLKGYSIGGAQVSEKHANFLINSQDATSDDFFHLINHIKSEAKILHNIELEQEIRYITTDTVHG